MRRAAIATATIALAAIPAVASGATVSLDKECYLEGSPLVLNASGFSPGQPLQVRSTGLLASASADPAGALAGTVAAPANPGAGPRAISSFVLTVAATDQTLAAQAPFQVANLAFSTSTGAQSPTARRTWRFSGFPADSTVYGHFLRKGKLYASYRFGKVDEPCGTLTRKAPGIPVKRAKSGKWTVQIDASRKYSKRSRVAGHPALLGSTTVFVTKK